MVTTSLLTTKFQVPHVHSDLVRRPHLMERLSQGLSRQITLISAPAGFGKTTLLGQWIEQTRPRVAWLSLDEGDDNPARFWLYVMTALQTLEGGLGADALVMLQAGYAGRVPIESILTSLLNDIHALSASDKIVLVLDDFHLIRTQATQDTLSFFLNHQPQQLHLIISSRSDPLLSLARFRARNQLAELRAADLRFTSDESAAFLNEGKGLGLSAGQIALLENSSEGWIAGLQLAAFSMQGRSDIASFIDSFTGSNRHIIDYLVEEVLYQQPEATQSFLLQTCILERLTAGLCDSLTLRNDGQTRLEQLEKANLFITALDDERRWYRYHHLFAEFLRHHLQRTQAESVPVLRRRASEWYERNGLLAEAIDYALAAGDLERAASLVESVARAMLLTGDTNRLLGWLEALPDELIRLTPQLCLAFAWALAVQGDTHRAEDRLGEIEVDPCCDDARYLLGSVAAIRANLACIRRDVPLALELSRNALDLLPEDSLAERAAVLLEMGSSFAIEGDFAEASRTLSNAITANEAAGNKVGVILGLSNLIGVKIMQGRLREAANIFSGAMRVSVAPSGSSLPFANLACLSMAGISYERNDLLAAEHHAKAGFEFSKQWGRPAQVVLARIHLARLAMAQGDWDKADAELQVAYEQLKEYDFPDVASLLSACRLRLLVHWGKAEAASRWIQERGLRLEDNPDNEHESEYVALAWSTILGATRRSDTTSLRQAVTLLEKMCERAEASGRRGNVSEMLAIRSLALYALGDTAKALVGLERALALAEPEGYIRTFVDLGPEMANLLRYAASRGVAPRYIETLLAAFERDQGASHWDEVRTAGSHFLSISTSPLAQSLSEREVEVLRLVAEGLSNQEIAGRLILAVGTVKRHINNIFGKLGVSSRIQAISRARELGLI